MGKPAPLSHTEGRPESQDPELVSEQEGYLRSNASVQFVASCIETTRKNGPEWLTPTTLRERYPTKVRMEWFKSRPDTRQALVTKISGVGKKSARVFGLDIQVTLLDSAVDSQDISISDYEQSFNVRDLACYGDIADIYNFTVERIPWTSDAQSDREIVGDLIKELLEPRGQNPAILTHLQVRRAIPERSWQTHIPDDIRGEIARDRLDREEKDPSKPYTAKDEFDRAPPQVLAKYIPLIDLKPIFLLAMEVMDFVPPPPPVEAPATDAAAVAETPAEEPKGMPTMHAPATEQEHMHNKPTALLPGSMEENAAAASTSSDANIETSELDASDIAEILPQSDLPPPPSTDEESKKMDAVDKSVEEALGDLAVLESENSEKASEPPSSSDKPRGVSSRRERHRHGSPPPLPDKNKTPS